MALLGWVGSEESMPVPKLPVDPAAAACVMAMEAVASLPAPVEASAAAAYALGFAAGFEAEQQAVATSGGSSGSSAADQTVFTHNASGRFESRFSAVTFMKSPAVLLKGMEGSTLGVWVAHGEGRAQFSSAGLLAAVLDQKLAPLRYADDDGKPTTAYPFNPNGSPEGIAGLCSADGR
jgi:phosphoribosylformylglycinamidine synthase